MILEGLTLPVELGGHPALDFCNTWAGWDGLDTHDYLQNYGHLAVWAGAVGLLPAERSATLRALGDHAPETAAGVLEQARRLRADLYGVLTGAGDGAAFGRVGREVEAAARCRRLRSDGARPPAQITWELDDRAGLRAPVAAVAWAAGELLTSADRHHVRACPGTGCGWLFLDRRGRRRWCTMAVCGNRAKVKRFADRRRV